MRVSVINLFLLALGIAPAVFADYADSCVKVMQDFMPGECSINLTWARIIEMNLTKRSFEYHVVHDIQAEMFDGINNPILSQPKCSGVNDENKCRLGSKYFPYPMEVAPDAKGNFLEFKFGDDVWHTNPNPETGESFVGSATTKATRPWCGSKTD